MLVEDINALQALNNNPELTDLTALKLGFNVNIYLSGVSNNVPREYQIMNRTCNVLFTSVICGPLRVYVLKENMTFQTLACRVLAWSRCIA